MRDRTHALPAKVVPIQVNRLQPTAFLWRTQKSGNAVSCVPRAGVCGECIYRKMLRKERRAGIRQMINESGQTCITKPNCCNVEATQGAVFHRASKRADIFCTCLS